MESSACHEHDQWSLNIKFGQKTLQVKISSTETVKDLKNTLQNLTNILPRGQKLIFKGKVLEDTTYLKGAGISNGSKLMLMASHGLHQGVTTINKAASSSLAAKTMNFRKGHNIESKKPIERSSMERWKATGVISLSGRCLEKVPVEVFASGDSIRALDLGSNYLREVPVEIENLSKLKRACFTGNNISSDGVKWQGLIKLNQLTFLALNQNQLSTIPSQLGMLMSLRQLDLSENKLVSLPDEIGDLKQLEILKANGNCLRVLPLTLGNCLSLLEVDLSSNLLQELPDSFGNLKNIKMLQLAHNGLKSFPESVLKGCLQLSTLHLHGNEITIDNLREMQGWEEFDNRRREKHNKQIEFGVMGPNGFDEGADSKRWDHWW